MILHRPTSAPPTPVATPHRVRSRAVRAVVAATIGALIAVAPAPPAAPQDPGPGPATPGPGTATATEAGSSGPLPELAAELADVPVSSEAYDAALARRDRLADERAAAQRLIEAKEAEIVALLVRDEDLTTEIERAQAEAHRWEEEEIAIAASVREIAIDSYVNGQVDGLEPMLALDAEAQQRAATQDVTIGSLSERRTAELERARDNARRNRQIEQVSTAVRAGVRQARADAQLTRDQATADVARLDIAVLEAEADMAHESRLARVAGADFPLVVLDAYWKGAQLMAVLNPGCGLPWWALAGIGKIESRHGTYGGAEVRPDGSLTRPIIGIPLTGAGGTAAIGDSDGGLIDGDPTVDRAAGPMQFIPQTWARWGRDGDGNGKIEIQNMYDATASAAAYLCASGPLTDDAGLGRAYFSYNHSLPYVASVLDQAKAYAASVTIPSG